jgi:hypothetical protein
VARGGEAGSMDGGDGYLEEEVVAEWSDGGVGLLGERGVHGGDVHRWQRKRRSRRGGAGARNRQGFVGFRRKFSFSTLSIEKLRKSWKEKHENSRVSFFDIAGPAQPLRLLFLN